MTRNHNGILALFVAGLILLGGSLQMAIEQNSKPEALITMAGER